MPTKQEITDKLLNDWQEFAERQKERNDNLEAEFEKHLESLNSAVPKIKGLESEKEEILKYCKNRIQYFKARVGSSWVEGSIGAFKEVIDFINNQK
jgi:hypothetical protein